MSKSVGTNSRVTAQKPSGVIINSADKFVLANTHTHTLSFLMNNHQASHKAAVPEEKQILMLFTHMRALTCH